MVSRAVPFTCVLADKLKALITVHACDERKIISIKDDPEKRIITLKYKTFVIDEYKYYMPKFIHNNNYVHTDILRGVKCEIQIKYINGKYYDVRTGYPISSEKTKINKNLIILFYMVGTAEVMWFNGSIVFTDENIRNAQVAYEFLEDGHYENSDVYFIKDGRAIKGDTYKNPNNITDQCEIDEVKNTVKIEGKYYRAPTCINQISCMSTIFKCGDKYVMVRPCVDHFEYYDSGCGIMWSNAAILNEV